MKSINKILSEEQLGGALRGFPTLRDVRNQFVSTVTEISDRLREKGIELTADQTRGLIIKIGNHHNAPQWNRGEAVWQIPNIVDATRYNLTMLTDGSVTLKQMLKRDIDRKIEEANQTKVPSHIPPQTVAVSNDGRYSLVECLTQRHLNEEIKALHGPNKSYGREIVENERNFSLRDAKSVPVAIIMYNIDTRSIVDIGGKSPKITGQENFFSALCQTIHQLGVQLPINKIKGLPQLPDDHALTKVGDVQPTEKVPLADIILGNARVDNKTPVQVFHQWFASPRMTIDVTNAPAILRLRLNAQPFVRKRTAMCMKIELCSRRPQGEFIARASFKHGMYNS